MSLTAWTRCAPSVALNSLLEYPATNEPQSSTKIGKVDYWLKIGNKRINRREGNRFNYLTSLVPPARIELAAHGLGMLKPRHQGINREKQGMNDFSGLAERRLNGLRGEKQRMRGVVSGNC